MSDEERAREILRKVAFDDRDLAFVISPLAAVRTEATSLCPDCQTVHDQLRARLAELEAALGTQSSAMRRATAEISRQAFAAVKLAAQLVQIMRLLDPPPDAPAKRFGDGTKDGTEANRNSSEQKVARK